jgi:hypothetical protein
MVIEDACPSMVVAFWNILPAMAGFEDLIILICIQICLSKFVKRHASITMLTESPLVNGCFGNRQTFCYFEKPLSPDEIPSEQVHKK